MKTALPFFVFGLLLFALTSCGSKPEDLIVGKWKRVDKPVTVEFTKDGTFIVQSQSGKIQTVSAKYKFISDGRILVEYANGLSSQTMRVAIDKVRLSATDESKGETSEFLRYNFDVMDDFSSDPPLAKVKLDGKWGFIDRTGNVVGEIKYDEVSDFHAGLAKVKLNGKWGFVKQSGEAHGQIQYDEIENFSGGLAKARLNGKWGFINEAGNEAVPFKYDEVDNFDYSSELAKVSLYARDNAKWTYGYVDKHGQEVFPLGRFEDVEFRHDGYARVKANGKYGIVKKNGAEVTPIKYDDITEFLSRAEDGWFSDGLTVVTLNGKKGLINESAKEITPLKYDDIGDLFITIQLVRPELISVRLGDKWGYINRTGNEVVALKFDKAMDFTDQYLDMKLQNQYGAVALNGSWGAVDKLGRQVLPLSKPTEAAAWEDLRRIDEGQK